MSETKRYFMDNSQCPYRDNIMCGLWRNHESEKRNCPDCGWNPEEEYRRIKEIKEDMADGRYRFGFYDKERRKYEKKSKRITW